MKIWQHTIFSKLKRTGKTFNSESNLCTNNTKYLEHKPEYGYHSFYIPYFLPRNVCLFNSSSMRHKCSGECFRAILSLEKHKFGGKDVPLKEISKNSLVL